MVGAKKIGKVIAAIAIPPLVIWLLIWPFTWEPPPPNPNPPNGTIYATVGLAAFCWLWATLAFYLTRHHAENVAERDMGNLTGVIALIAGWGFIGLLLLAYFGWNCYIWPWEPAICLNG